MWQKIKNTYHLTEAILANVLYGFPSKKIKVIGVTGTDGKTTTSHLIYHVIHELGCKVSISSSVFTNIAGEITDTGLHVTTQSRWKIQENLKKSVDAGYEYFILETTSHGIDQYRNWGIEYDAAVVTNVTEEHLDYHKTYDNYLRTKAKLLLAANVGVVNRDDRSYRQIKEILTEKNKTFKTFSKFEKADYVWSKEKISSDLEGDFNKENLLAAYAICSELGFDQDKIRKALKTFKLPLGRFDTVYDKDFKIVIDFAHTPNSIRKILSTLKKGSKGRLIHVFGSAGLRDYLKRPEMGKASAEYADLTTLTEEDFRTEKIEDINEKVIDGFKARKFTTYKVINDRQEAIEFALKQAKKGDVVAITGKGHEKSLARGTKEYDWDEYKAVKNALKKL